MKVIRIKIVLQDGIKDCGICSLLSIIRYYGGEVSKEYLREITNTTKEGVSLFHLMMGAQKLGFETNALYGNIEEINVNNLPCIAHIVANKNYHHFLVIYSVDFEKSQVTLMDPAKGKKTISLSEFKLLSSKNYLFLKPLKPMPIMKPKKKIYKSMKLTLKKSKKGLIIMILLTSFCFICTIITSFHLKFLMEYAINYQLEENIIFISFLMIVFYSFKNINIYLRNLLLLKWTIFIDELTSTIFYEKILLLPYLFYKNRTTGEVLSRFKDLNVIRAFFSNFFCTITTDILSCFVFSIVMFQINHHLTIVLTLFSCIYFIIPIMIKNKKQKQLQKIHQYEDLINSYLVQGTNNVDTIKGNHLEKRFIDKFKYSYQSFLSKVYEYSRLNENYLLLKGSLQDVLLFIIYGMGAYYVIHNQLSLVNLIVYQSFFSYDINCIQRIVSAFDQYPDFKVSMNRVEDLFLIEEEKFQNHYYYLPFSLQGKIVYNDIDYQIGSKKLFNHLSLTIEEKDKVLLCGESGSGKSTLMKMLLRYVEIEYGKIKIANIDINHYHLENLRSYITYITNNEYLFSDTIRNNICLFKEEKEDSFEQICHLCLVDELIQEKGLTYDSLIEENGFNFSSGEKQRIILARGLYRKSNIYILDEALSQIDVYKERKIIENIFHYLKDKTVIIISHRFHNKKYFHRILKLEGGKIIEGNTI